MNIIIQRERRFSYAARNIRIFIDGTIAGSIGNGKEISIPVSDDTHGIAFKIGNKTMAFASVYPGGVKDIRIVCWASGKGGVEFYSANQNLQKQTDANKSNDWFGWIALIISVIVLLFFLFRPRIVLFFPI